MTTPLLPALTPSGALIEAAATAALYLEVGPVDRAVVDRCVSDAVVGLALVAVEYDDQFAPRWRAAGDDFVARAIVLREAILWVLTPDPAAAPAARA